MKRKVAPLWRRWELKNHSLPQVELEIAQELTDAISTLPVYLRTGGGWGADVEKQRQKESRGGSAVGGNDVRFEDDVPIRFLGVGDCVSRRISSMPRRIGMDIAEKRKLTGE